MNPFSRFSPPFASFPNVLFRHIISLTDGRTIQIWEALTGKLLTLPLVVSMPSSGRRLVKTLRLVVTFGLGMEMTRGLFRSGTSADTHSTCFFLLHLSL
jgi:hypothetical protein